MSLVDPLIPPRHQRLLAAVLLHPERTYSYNELIRVGGPGRGANQTALQSLLKCGFLIDERIGNQHRFRANIEFPLYSEFRSICVKTFGVHDRIAGALSPLSKKIEFAFIFGSIVTGKDRADSDIDLLVVGSVGLTELNSVLSEVEDDLKRSVHVNLYSVEEWSAKRLGRVMQNILTGPKITVIGHDPTSTANSESARNG